MWDTCWKNTHSTRIDGRQHTGEFSAQPDRMKAKMKTASGQDVHGAGTYPSFVA